MWSYSHVEMSFEQPQMPYTLSQKPKTCYRYITLQGGRHLARCLKVEVECLPGAQDRSAENELD